MRVVLLRSPALAAAAAGSVLLLGACGTHSTRATTPATEAAMPATPPTTPAAPAAQAVVCPARARAAVARSFGVSPSAVSWRAFTGSQSMPECDLAPHRRSGRPVTVATTIDTAPQADARLERTAVEAAQSFNPSRVVAPPQDIPGLGLDADWFPPATQLMTTDGTRLITVKVSWDGVPQARMIALADATARAYLAPAPLGRGAPATP